jgi:pimeloyl-ACP methyl ester carboxylesterase
MQNDNQRAGGRWSRYLSGSWLTASVAGLVTVAVVLLATVSPAQDAPAKGKAARARAAKVAKKAPPNAADPIAAKNKEQEIPRDAPIGSYHYRLKLHAFDDTSLASLYYPGKLDTNTPAVLLIHEKDRSSRDFEDSITDLKGLGLAEHLQSIGYAVLAIDLRGYGENARRAGGDREWREMGYDLQAAYQFLLDRHNRGELNLSKLGVVGMGEGANLAAYWAYLPGGAVSSEGRATDLAAMALISPMPEGEGMAFPRLITTLAPRIPVLLTTGERDASSHETVRRVRAGIERTRQNKVILYPSSLHGYKLLRLEPKAALDVAKFLEGTIKLKAADWEPRYNVTPVTYTDIQVVRHIKADDAEKAAPKEKEQEKAKEQEKKKDEDK